MTQQKSTAELQLEMMQLSKRELIARARIAGWRGDEARASKLQLATWFALREQPAPAPAEREASAGDDRQHAPFKQSGGQGAQQQPAQAQPQQQPSPQQSEGGQYGSSNSEQDTGNSAEANGLEKQQPQQSGAEGEQSGAEGEQSEGEQSGAEGEQSEGEQQQPQQSDKQRAVEQAAKNGQFDEMDSAQGEQPSPQPEQPPIPQPPNNKQWKALLEKHGIKTPHSMLRKVYALATVGKLNVLLEGEAGTGKSTLGAQLAKLLELPFEFVSCSAGMSESQLVGWLLPIKTAGTFDYVPSPLVNTVEKGGVFLFDEMDRLDAGGTIVTNALTANGYMSLPHRVNGESKAHRTIRTVLLAACNTLNGADENYTSAVQQDAAALDRWYPVRVPFSLEIATAPFEYVKLKSDTKDWKPAPVERADLPALERAVVSRCDAIREAVQSLRITRVVGVRLYHKMLQAVRSGVTVADATEDLLLSFTPDEKRRVMDVINRGGR